MREVLSVPCPLSTVQARLEKAEICMHCDSKWLLGSERVSTLEMWAFQFVLFLIPCRQSPVSTLHHCSAHYRRAKNSTHCSCCLLLTSTPELQMGRSDCSDSIMFVIIKKDSPSMHGKFNSYHSSCFPAYIRQSRPSLHCRLTSMPVSWGLLWTSSRQKCSVATNETFFSVTIWEKGWESKRSKCLTTSSNSFFTPCKFLQWVAFGIKLKMATTKL